MSYLSIVIWVFTLVAFHKIGELDKDIGNPLGLATGAVVLLCSLFFAGGYLGTTLYILAGFAFLTIYKMARSDLRPEPPTQKGDCEPTDAPGGKKGGEDS